MLKRNTASISSLRPSLRTLTPFLYFCLILSLTWHDFSFSSSIHIAPTNIASTPTIVAGHLGDSSETAVNKGNASRRLPPLLTSVPKLPSGPRLRLENQDDDLPTIHFSWVVASNALCLPSLRIDPIVWDSGTPSFLLASAYGLVPFAIPPPFRIA